MKAADRYRSNRDALLQNVARRINNADSTALHPGRTHRPAQSITWPLAESCGAGPMLAIFPERLIAMLSGGLAAVGLYGVMASW